MVQVMVLLSQRLCRNNVISLFQSHAEFCRIHISAPASYCRGADARIVRQLVWLWFAKQIIYKSGHSPNTPQNAFCLFPRRGLEDSCCSHQTSLCSVVSGPLRKAGPSVGLCLCVRLLLAMLFLRGSALLRISSAATSKAGNILAILYWCTSLIFISALYQHYATIDLSDKLYQAALFSTSAQPHRRRRIPLKGNQLSSSISAISSMPALWAPCFQKLTFVNSFKKVFELYEFVKIWKESRIMPCWRDWQSLTCKRLECQVGFQYSSRDLQEETRIKLLQKNPKKQQRDTWEPYRPSFQPCFSVFFVAKGQSETIQRSCNCQTDLWESERESDCLWVSERIHRTLDAQLSATRATDHVTRDWVECAHWRNQHWTKCQWHYYDILIICVCTLAKMLGQKGSVNQALAKKPKEAAAWYMGALQAWLSAMLFCVFCGQRPEWRATAVRKFRMYHWGK